MKEKITPHPMDLEGLSSPEQVGEEEAPPEQIEDGEVPPVMAEEA